MINIDTHTMKGINDSAECLKHTAIEILDHVGHVDSVIAGHVLAYLLYPVRHEIAPPIIPLCPVIGCSVPTYLPDYGKSKIEFRLLQRLRDNAAEFLQLMQ